jgi:tetratricopeptide (TPR) repeat protein
MSLESYTPCPCGSGKKFKWCCEPIYKEIDRAFTQENEGQHDVAARIMAEIVAKHPTNPEAWGRQAQLLLAHDKLEEAEQALEKAFAINPNYPFGLLLRARLRFSEGEVAGSLLLARRAADAYDPEAKDQLAEVYALIYQAEMRLNRPIAGHAAVKIYAHCAPADDQARTMLDAEFGPKGRQPEAVRRDYQLLPPTPTVTGDRRAAWDRALGTAIVPRLGDLARLFEQLTKDDPNDLSAWFNLGVARAWIGDNRGALDALNQYLEREPDDLKTTPAATLMEVMRFGHGMEDDCDYLEYSFAFTLRDGDAVSKLLTDWQKANRLLVMPRQQDNTLLAMVLEFGTTGIVTSDAAPPRYGRLAGYFLAVGGVIRVWGFDNEAVGRLRDEMRPRLSIPASEAQERRGPRQFHEVVTDALVFPVQVPQEEAQKMVLEEATKYFEGTWIHKPRKSLNGKAPTEAVGSPLLRKKLRGIVQFIQDCAHIGLLASYDFNRLRDKVGLEGAVPTSQTAAAATTGPNIAAMNATDLASLNLETLTDAQMEEAFQTAQKVDAPDLARQFAQTLVSRPATADRADRFPLYSWLLQRALRDGHNDAALDYVNAGESADCTNNEGRRRNEYELWRGKVHAKRGELTETEDVFRRLIERVPADVKARGAAAEAMLTLKQPAKALKFAEDGVAEARKKNDRDSEGYLMELAAAAKKQMR